MSSVLRMDLWKCDLRPEFELSRGALSVEAVKFHEVSMKGSRKFKNLLIQEELHWVGPRGRYSAKASGLRTFVYNSEKTKQFLTSSQSTSTKVWVRGRT